jgi:N-acetylglucosaminyl-diphospho-decaprenol L-rhamnosyltransferase
VQGKHWKSLEASGVSELDRIKVSIVTYNSAKEIANCLESLESGLEGLEYDVTVVDNASSDDTVALIRSKFDKVEVIETGKNLGFGAAHNLVIRNADTPYVLVLNPDAMLQEKAVSRLLLGIKSDARVAVVGPRVEYEDGWPQLSFGMFPGLFADLRQSKLVKSVQAREKDSIKKLENLLKNDVNPGWVSGSCFLARRDLLEKVGYFDENFFLYLEDVDLCLRLRKSGYKIKVVSNAVCRHAEGKSHESSETMTSHYRDSRLIYENKHGGWVNFMLYKLLKASKSKIKYRKELVWKR